MNKGIAAAITALNPIAGGVYALIDKIVPDKGKAAEAKKEFDTLLVSNAHEIAMGQLGVNQQEAKHKSVFVAGWRPAIGWVCMVALAWHFVLAQMLMWVFAFYTLNAGEGAVKIPPPPDLDIGTLMTLLFGMLGLGAYRSYDKLKGTDTKRVREAVPPPPVPANEAEWIHADHAAGITVSAIARKYGLSVDAVLAILYPDGSKQ